MRKMRILTTLIILFGIFYAVYNFTPFVNRNSISINIKSPQEYFSKNKDIVVNIDDKNAGIQEVSVKIISMNTIITLYDKKIDDKFVKHFSINFKTNKVIPVGSATLVVSVKDYSKNNFLSGFEKIEKRAVIVDSTKPVVHLLSGISRIKITGSAVAVYYVKDDNLENVYLGVTHGNKVDKFKAFSASKIFGKKGVYLSFFTYPIDKTKNYSTDIYAIDKAGNITKAHIPVYYSSIRLKKSKIRISDRFITDKVLRIMENENIGQKSTLLDDFLYINNTERRADTNKIRQVCRNSVNNFLWKGRFMQLKNSKVEATFGDKRAYYYKGQLVDIKRHMGYDLASIKNAKVNAANNGIVVYEGYLGVYGNTMIIDHGFGIFSLYAHLQDFLVKKGAVVKRGQYIAITDTTGLAGGDHLHFDILIDGYYANPIEWWDKHWIKNNIQSVIDSSKVRLSLIEQ